VVTLTIKVPEALAAKLNALVRRRGQPKSEIVREAIERAVAADGAAQEGSALDLAGDLKGIVKGPKDLSTNPKYMKGYGE